MKILTLTNIYRSLFALSKYIYNFVFQDIKLCMIIEYKRII